MHRQTILLFFLLCIFVTGLRGQDAEIDRLIRGELRMTFPGIYFKHTSTDYAAMPYTVDSCLEYIAAHIKEINDLVIWRDSLETEKLTKQRIKKLKKALSKYKVTDNIVIESMGKEQKISRQTIRMGIDYERTQYLLSLNSVFEISKIRYRFEKKEKNHIIHPRIWCWDCWKNGFHMSKSSRELRKKERRRKKESKAT